MNKINFNPKETEKQSPNKKLKSDQPLSDCRNNTEGQASHQLKSNNYMTGS
jgi:hypothetical protein